MLEVEGEREEKEEKKRNSKKKKYIYLNKIGKKIEFWDVGCIVKLYDIVCICLHFYEPKTPIIQKAEEKMHFGLRQKMRSKRAKFYGPQEVHKSKHSCAFSLITVGPMVITKMPININQFSHA